MGVSSRVRFAALLGAVGVAFLTFFSSHVSTQGTPRRGRPVVFRGREAADGEVLIKYRDRASSRQQALESQADIEQAQTFASSGVRHLRSRRLSTAALIAQLEQDPEVEYVEPNYIVRTTILPNDPSFAALWGLYNTGSNTMGGGGLPGADIDAPSAWNTTVGSRANVVGVIDTGIDYTHPDLSANVWTAPWPFTVNVGGQSITCAAGTHGFNAITRTCDPMDDATNPHGTHVAGTIGASGDNGTGVVGVNWVASMMGLKFLGQNGSGYTSDAVAAVEFALQTKAAFASSNGANVRVLSNSWGGGGFSLSMLGQINAANAADILFVAAAGNSAGDNDVSPHYPSNYSAPNVVSVAATDSSDSLASFSNYGVSTVHLGAPGVGIYSTGSHNTYLGMSGTSMATPQVSGAAALVLAMCQANTAELRAMLLSTVDVVAPLAGKVATGGRLNVARAMQSCPRPIVTSVQVTANKAAPQGVNTAVTFSAGVTGGQAPYQYRWFVWDGTAWTPMTGWASGNTFTWTPSTANGSYQIRAAARSAWNSGIYEAFDTLSFPIKPIVTAVALSANKTAPQAVNTPVTFTASASGGEAPYQYRWFVFDGAVWTGVTAWSSTNTYTWTPSVANASYQVRAAARSAWNTGLNENWGTVSFAIKPVVTAVAVSANKTAPQAVNTAINFTASASGGEAPYQYRWFVWDGTAWTGVTAWSTTNTYTWTPSVANASYQIRAAARSAWNTGLNESWGTVNFAIKPVVTSVSVGANKTAPQNANTAITFTANASGGEAPYQYRWFVWDGAAWVGLTAWSSSNVYTWTPSVASPSYQIRAAARSAWNSGLNENWGTVNFAIQ